MLAFLPYDIIHSLCGWLDKPTLIEVNMINRYFYLATANLIWAHVALSYSELEGSWGSFESIVTTLLHSPRGLTKYIESLWIEISEPFITSESEADTLRRGVSATIRVLQLSTGLKRLRLYLHRDRCFGQLFYEQLASTEFSFKLEECIIKGSFTPPKREFTRFLQRMTSLKRLTMFGIRDQEYGWLNYKPNPDDWPFLESIHFSDMESVATLVPGRPIRKITVWECSDSLRLQSLITEPVETMRTFKMLSWESDHTTQGADALATYISDLHVAFPRISTILIGYWYSSQIDDDGEARLPPMFTDAAFRALGEFEDCARPLLSSLHTHCPSLSKVFLRTNLFTPPEEYENWVWVTGTDCFVESMWERKEWVSPEALV